MTPCYSKMCSKDYTSVSQIFWERLGGLTVWKHTAPLLRHASEASARCPGSWEKPGRCFCLCCWGLHDHTCWPLISWNPTSLKCQFTTSHWRNWHSFSLFPAFITQLTSTPPQIPTSYDSCVHFLYLNLSPNSSLSLLLRLSLVFLLSLSSSVRPRGCHHYVPASRRSLLTPFLRCCPDSKRQLLKPASLCGARGGATS